MATFPSIDLSRFDIRALSMPEMKLPTVDLPKIDLPKVDLPKVEMPEIDVDRVVGVARDAAYVGIGLAVLGVQQAQVRRRELQAQIERGVKTLRERAA